MVNASPERVMAWWFHPDRRDEFQTSMEKFDFFAGDVSMTESTADGLRIRDIHWKDNRGQDHHHHIETVLTSDEMPARNGDRFVAPFSQTHDYRTPEGRKVTLRCSGRTEFIPQATGDTEIIVVHSHILVGGGWIARLSQHKSELTNTDRQFRDRIARCQAAGGPSVT